MKYVIFLSKKMGGEMSRMSQFHRILSSLATLFTKFRNKINTLFQKL